MTAPTVTASTLLSRPMALCANLLAASESWQQHLDSVHREVSDAASALEHIYFPYVTDGVDDNGVMEHRRSRAIINPSVHYNLKNIGSQSWSDHGDVIMSLEVLPPPETYTKPEDEMLWFLNLVGSVIAEMAALSGVNLYDFSGTYLNAIEFILVDGPSESIVADENGEKFYGVTFQVMWKG